MWKIKPPKSWGDGDFWASVIFGVLEGMLFGAALGLVIVLVMELAR